MEKILIKNFNKGLLGGFTLIDDLVKLKINKNNLLKKYNLDSNKPINLFAPTWGTKKRSSWGINNLKYLNEIENLITIPHPSDYLIGKFNKSLP